MQKKVVFWSFLLGAHTTCLQREGLTAGQTITIDNGANNETVVIVSVTGGGRGFQGGQGVSITIAAPHTIVHSAGAQVSGTGNTLTAPLAKAHAIGGQGTGNFPTQGAPHQYTRKP